MDFQNRLSGVRGGTATQTFAPDSVAALGIADLPPTTGALVRFVRGCWTSTVTLAP